jgi:hypothetical protein
MLEINVMGDIQTGKTGQLVALANQKISEGARVLYICPTTGQAVFARDHRGLSPKAHIVPASHTQHLIKKLRMFNWDVIILDEMMGSLQTPEGNLLDLARSRLQFTEFGLLAYSSSEFTRGYEWISKAKWWNPLTWRNGYWKAT